MDHNIDITRSFNGRFNVFYGQLALKPTRTPMCDAARYLLTHNLAAPEDRLVSTLNGALSMTGQIGWLAKHTIVDDERGIKFVKWSPFPVHRYRPETPKSPSPGT